MVIVVIYVCAVTCGRSLAVPSVWCVLISFSSVLVFSPTLLSLLLLIPYYYYCLCCYYYYWLLLLFFISTELLALCDGCLGWDFVWQAGLVAGLGIGQALGVLLLPGLGVRSSSPQVPGRPTSICDAGVNVSLQTVQSKISRSRCIKQIKGIHSGSGFVSSFDTP